MRECAAAKRVTGQPVNCNGPDSLLTVTHGIHYGPDPEAGSNAEAEVRGRKKNPHVVDLRKAAIQTSPVFWLLMH